MLGKNQSLYPFNSRLAHISAAVTKNILPVSCKDFMITFA